MSLLFSTTASGADRLLSLVSSSGSSTITSTLGNEPFIIEIRLNDATDIAGASFTITYDTQNLFLANVESSFFQAFDEQITPAPGCVTLDKEYCSPIVDNIVNNIDAPVTTGSMIAAVRVDNGAGTNVTIFTLKFQLKDGGVPGQYPVDIIQSRIENVSSGYTTVGGDLIPFLVGIDYSGGYPTYSVPSPVGCDLIINDAFVDTDVDGIDDNWEITYVPSQTTGNPLDVFSTDGDFDRDGYSDYQEYLNTENGELDPSGENYNPTVKNASSGTGYVSRKKSLPGVHYLLLNNDD
jgi:hypothetical protein